MIVLIIIPVACALLLRGLVANEKVVIWANETRYEDNKNAENLYKLCMNLYGTEEYEKIIKYFPQYFNDEVAYNRAFEEVGYEYPARQHQEVFRLEYCLALLHSSDYTGFSNEFSECVKSFSTVDMIYYYLALDVQLRPYTEQQFKNLYETLELIEVDEDTKSQISRLNIEAYILNELNDSRYSDVVQEIEMLNNQHNQNQSGHETGDGSVS